MPSLASLYSFLEVHGGYIHLPSLCHYQLRAFCQLQQALQIDALGSFNRQPQRPIPDQLRQRPQPARDAKCGGVVERLVEAVVVEQHAGPAVHVRERVLRPAVFRQHPRRDLGVALHEPEERVLGDFGAGGGELDEGGEAGVGSAEDGVAVAGDHLAGLEGGPEVGFYVGVGGGGADLGLHFEDPAEDFLGGESAWGRISVVGMGKERVHTRVVDQRGLAIRRCS